MEHIENMPFHVKDFFQENKHTFGGKMSTLISSSPLSPHVIPAKAGRWSHV